MQQSRPGETSEGIEQSLSAQHHGFSLDCAQFAESATPLGLFHGNKRMGLNPVHTGGQESTSRQYGSVVYQPVLSGFHPSQLVQHFANPLELDYNELGGQNSRTFAVEPHAFYCPFLQGCTPERREPSAGQPTSEDSDGHQHRTSRGSWA